MDCHFGYKRGNCYNYGGYLQLSVHKKTKIKNFTTEINYNKELNKWYPLKIKYSSEIEADIMIFVTFEGTSNTFIRFDNYFKLDQN